MSLRDQIEPWVATCKEYRQQLIDEGNFSGAEYYRGALEAFQRVLSILPGLSWSHLQPDDYPQILPNQNSRE